MITEEQKVIKVIKKALPAVVSITISRNTPKGTTYTIPMYGKGRSRLKKIDIGGGSGFIISKDGIILTNRHIVAEKGVEYEIITADGKSHSADIIAKDHINDTAILKIKGNNLPTIPLGNSDKVKLGQTVIAIGNALALFPNSISKGIISGLSRVLSTSTEDGKLENLRGLIQTDAAINLGNSGGPLLNLKGEAIGVNTAVLIEAENIGFAIPINNIKPDLEEIKKHGRIVQPYLGIRYMIINQKITEKTGLPVNYGAWILSELLPGDQAIAPGSPAEKAGLKENDIILEFNRQKVDSQHHLQDIIRYLSLIHI